ncbi:MAG: 30S ribosomal protein S1, partial [Desulfotignum sp.]
GLEPGVTGLMPVSAVRNAADAKSFDALKPGDAVTVLVQQVDEENRRITLAPPDQKDTENWQQFAGDQKGKPLGTMESVFLEAMKKKK